LVFAVPLAQNNLLISLIKISDQNQTKIKPKYHLLNVHNLKEESDQWWRIQDSKSELKLYMQTANMRTGVNRMTEIQKWAMRRSKLMFLAALTPMKQSTSKQNPNKIKNSQYKYIDSPSSAFDIKVTHK